MSFVLKNFQDVWKSGSQGMRDQGNMVNVAKSCIPIWNGILATCDQTLLWSRTGPFWLTGASYILCNWMCISYTAAGSKFQQLCSG